jgi:membrane-bound lytic murein transglycosylase F
VRENLPLLADEAWYLRVKNGYARGWEAQYTVDRVRQFANVLEWGTTARHQAGPDASALTGSLAGLEDEDLAQDEADDPAPPPAAGAVSGQAPAPAVAP